MLSRSLLLLLLLAFASVSCTGSRVAVHLEQASIRTIDHATLFPRSSVAQRDRSLRHVLQLNISSQTDLLKYFEERHTQLQVRCWVEGSKDGKEYNGFSVGPIAEKAIGETTSHHYTIYSFIDLEADEVQYKSGKPASTMDLRLARFDALKCHLLGVVKAPVPYPKSNDFIVSSSTFRELLRPK